MKQKLLIIGGTSDLGIQIAKQFAAHFTQPWELILAGRNQDQLDLINASIKSPSLLVSSTIVLDVANDASVNHFIKTIDSDITICIYTIGSLGDQEQDLVSSKSLADTIQINYTAALSLLNAVAENMINQNIKGTIVGVSSVAGERGRQSNFIYGSAKAGFTAYLSGLRNYLFPHQIHVLSVIPGFMDTKMIEGIKTPPFLTTSPEKAAAIIYRSIMKQKNTVYISWIWQWIMLLIKAIPEPIFKKMKL
ncbi:MAG: SDR family NAD(P)-dependent oxidoreductase [Bacteroidota bacterium]